MGPTQACQLSPPLFNTALEIPASVSKPKSGKTLGETCRPRRHIRHSHSERSPSWGLAARCPPRLPPPPTCSGASASAPTVAVPESPRRARAWRRPLAPDPSPGTYHVKLLMRALAAPAAQAPDSRIQLRWGWGWGWGRGRPSSRAAFPSQKPCIRHSGPDGPRVRGTASHVQVISLHTLQSSAFRRAKKLKAEPSCSWDVTGSGSHRTARSPRGAYPPLGQPPQPSAPPRPSRSQAYLESGPSPSEEALGRARLHQQVALSSLGKSSRDHIP